MSEDAAVSEESATAPRRQPARRPLAIALILLCVLAVVLAVRDYRVRAQAEVRAEMVAAATAGAVNLTTIDFKRVDEDVQRILDSSTGAFRDDFEKRAPAFAEAARQAQSTSVGTVTEAAVESVDGDSGRILVALTVMTSNRGVPEQSPRGWRTRVSVIRTAGGMKLEQVEFVS